MKGVTAGETEWGNGLFGLQGGFLFSYFWGGIGASDSGTA
jgi:hypothetical protein